MDDIFRIQVDADIAAQLRNRSPTRGRLTSDGRISLPDTQESLGIDLDAELSNPKGDVRSLLAARLQEIVAGRTALEGVGAQIEDDVLDQRHDPLLPLLQADVGIRTSAILAIGLLGIRTKIVAHRVESSVVLHQRERHGPVDMLNGRMSLNNRVHWFREDRRQGVIIGGGLSETMRIALIGQPLVRLLSHPRLDPLGLTITSSGAHDGARSAMFDTDHADRPVRLGDVRA